MKHNLNEHLINAASEVLSEAKEPLFKVGDEVSLYHTPNNFGSGKYYKRVGKVVKTNTQGHTHVDFGDVHHITGKPFHRVFDHKGYEMKSDHITHPSVMQKLVSKTEADKGLEIQRKRKEHRDDMEHVISGISKHKNDLGVYKKIDKATAEHLKSLIDKHTHSE